MIILPAIDIQNGECVRLYQGDFSTAHKVSDSPQETAAQFRKAGAEWVHMVDLDGAKEARAKNTALFLEIAKHSGLKVELGGGIRTLETVETYLESGISRVILGSAAVKNPELVEQAVKRFGERIAVGIDAKNGMVATEGWLDTSEVHYLELAKRMEGIGVRYLIYTDTKRMEGIGVRYLIYTDISRDGALSGVNLEQLGALNRAVSCEIIASGGVSGLADVEACKSLGLYGVICGKAVYTGALPLESAIEMAGDQRC